MYETIKKHTESDYLAALTSEQKVTYRLLQSTRMPDGSRVPGVVPEKDSGAEKVERAGAELYRIFLTDDPGYAATREAIKTKGEESADNVVRILSAAVSQSTGMDASSCVSYTVYLIVTILRAGFAITLESFVDEDRTMDV